LEFEIPSWDDIERYLLELSQKIISLNHKFDAIICIWRGGACPSRILSDFLNINAIYNITVEYYEDINKKKEKPAITQPLTADLKNKEVLICDDVSDTGKSLITVRNSLSEAHCGSITTATVYIKPWTEFIPDYYARETDKWIIFPWECIESIKRVTSRLQSEGKPLEAIKGELVSKGFPRRLVEVHFSQSSES
jgi:hypoxanthine phosphoribosyltransferase